MMKIKSDRGLLSFCDFVTKSKLTGLIMIINSGRWLWIEKLKINDLYVFLGMWWKLILFWDRILKVEESLFVDLEVRFLDCFVRLAESKSLIKDDQLDMLAGLLTEWIVR